MERKGEINIYICILRYIQIFIYSIYPCIIQHTGNEDTQTYQVEVVILILNTKFL